MKTQQRMTIHQFYAIKATEVFVHKNGFMKKPQNAYKLIRIMYRKNQLPRNVEIYMGHYPSEFVKNFINQYALQRRQYRDYMKIQFGLHSYLPSFGVTKKARIRAFLKYFNNQWSFIEEEISHDFQLDGSGDCGPLIMQSHWNWLAGKTLLLTKKLEITIEEIYEFAIKSCIKEQKYIANDMSYQMQWMTNPTYAYTIFEIQEAIYKCNKQKLPELKNYPNILMKMLEQIQVVQYNNFKNIELHN